MTDNIIMDFIEKKLAGPASQQAASAQQRVLWKGLVAGLVGGLVATGAKTLAEKVYPPRTHGEPEPPDVLVDKVTGQVGAGKLDSKTKTFATEAVHWGFGAAVGAAYGAVAEYYPAATARDGATFGVTLMGFAHEGALPALGLSRPPAQQTNREKSSELVTHVVFGVVAELVRRSVRKTL